MLIAPAPSATGDAAAPRRAVIIYNPTAGQRRRRRLAACIARLEALGCRIDLRPSRCPGDAEAIAAGLTPADGDVVAAAGGDGTINEVVNGLCAARDPIPALAIIPLGTANVLAAEIGLSGKPEAVARAVAFGPARKIHLGRVNGRHFVMMAGIGFDAHVVEHVSLMLKRGIGRLAYLAAVLGHALSYPFPVCTATIDGRDYRARTVLVCNGRFYGGPFAAVPQASLGLAKLHVCLLREGGWRQVLRYGAALLAGRLSTLPDVTILAADSLTVSGPEGAPVQGDGDIIAHLPARFCVSDRTIDLVMPA